MEGCRLTTRSQADARKLALAGAGDRDTLDGTVVQPEEQIRALLEGRCFELACRELGVTEMRHHDYAKVFTVTRADIDHFVQKNGLPASHVRYSPSSYDGVYLLKQNTSWVTYYQERGIRFNEVEHSSREGATERALTLLLESSGTGLRF
jgi:hypothetical protein